MGKLVKVLSIDGGGIRGIIPAMLLAELEARTQCATASLFDLIAGTSTGGILALGLAKPSPAGGPQYAAQELVGLYEHDSEEIFQSVGFFEGLFDQKYSSEGIERVLNRYFDDACLRDALTDVLITSYDIEVRRPYFFSSADAKSRLDHDYPMKYVARATSAAPTYFEPARVTAEGPIAYRSLIDGGVFANNPAMCAYAEARRRFPQRREILLVSLGTGVITRRLPHEDVVDWGLAEWARPILDVVLDGVSDSVDYQLTQLRASANLHYFRFQRALGENQGDLDNASKRNVRDLKALAEELIEESEPKLQELCRHLFPSG